MLIEEYFCVNKINGNNCGNPVPPLGFICEECYNNGEFGKTNPIIIEETIKECMYQMQRGRNKGEYCKRPTVEGSNFCSMCIRKKAAIGQAINTPTVNHNPNDNTNTIYRNPVDNTPLISVRSITHVLQRNEELFESSMCREVTHGFIISMNGAPIPIVIGYTNHHDDSEILPLTDEKRRIATALTLNIEQRVIPVIPVINLREVSHTLRMNEMVFESKLYRDISSGLIVSIGGDNLVNTAGYTDHHDDTEILPLTDEKIRIARSLGINVFRYEDAESAI